MSNKDKLLGDAEHAQEVIEFYDTFSVKVNRHLQNMACVPTT